MADQTATGLDQLADAEQTVTDYQRLTDRIRVDHGPAGARLFARAFVAILTGHVSADRALALLRAIVRDGDTLEIRAMVAEVEGGGR